MVKEVEKYYDAQAQREWERLERRPMELALTTRALKQYLPQNSRVLDVGGGPGRYAINLAQQGHQTTLVDLSNANVELAKVKAHEAGVELEGFVHGNALDLSSFQVEAYDAVLLFGPLYHLTDPGDRDTAIREALSKLKPGGLIFAAFINRYAFLHDIIKSDPRELLNNANAQNLLKHGVNHADWGFTSAWFTHPEEIAPVMEGHGLDTQGLLAIDGFICMAADKITSLPQEHFDAWEKLCWQLADDPSLLGSCEHLLYIGRK